MSQGKENDGVVNKMKIPVLHWPQTCPDFNPIENIWKDIDQQLQNFHLSNREQLREAIEDIWSKYPQAQCQKLVNFIPTALAE